MRKKYEKEKLQKYEKGLKSLGYLGQFILHRLLALEMT